MGKDELDDFNASNGWLQRWKDNYGIRERRICGEGDDVPVITVHAWIERLPEITQGYALCDIWNMDELGLFFKALPEKGLAEKSISAKGGKKCKQRCTVAIFVAADGSKVTDPVVVGRSRKPNCFRNLKDISRPLNTHYFNNKKSWLNTEIMEVILTRLDRRLSGEGRKVLLFLDNATCHPPTLQTKLENIFKDWLVQ